MALPHAQIITCVAAMFLAACSAFDPPPAPSQVLASGLDVHWYRGNLHAHTLWSDGNELPEAVAHWYRANGYHFLAITEHDTVPDSEQWISAARRPDGMKLPRGPFSPDRQLTDHGEEFRLRPLGELESMFNAPGSFLLLRGEEISDAVGPVTVHINAFNLASSIPPTRAANVNDTVPASYETINGQARNEARDILAQLNHPNFTYAITAEHLMRLPGVAFFEVYNGHPLANNLGDGLRMSTESLWDVALAWRLDVLGLPVLYGTATDDSHHYQPGGDASPGRGWIEVLSASLTPDSLFDAMRQGRFYASTGVRLRRIVATNDRLEIEVDPEPDTRYTIEFIGTRRGFDPTAAPPISATGRPIYASRRYDTAIGTILSKRKANRATYRFHVDDLYVRARVTATRPHHAPSQPLQFAQAWVQPVVAPAGHRPSRPGLRPPAPPPAHLRQGITRRFQALRGDEYATLMSSPAISCSLDGVIDALGIARLTYPAQGTLSFVGWIADWRAGRVPDSFAIVLDGPRDYLVEDGPGRRRPDLAKHLGGPQFERGGFHSNFELRDVVPGNYRIRLIGFTEGKAATCDSGKSLRVS